MTAGGGGGFWAPITSILGKLNSDLASVLGQTGLRQKLVDLGLEIEPSTPQEFADFMKAEIAKYANVVRLGKIRLD